jgi:predicted RNase H-like HicB family nuclease
MAGGFGMKHTFKVVATWDDEASVWVAESDDLPGLITEADTLDSLMSKLKVMIPELLEANGGMDDGDIPFTLLSSGVTVAHLNHA